MLRWIALACLLLLAGNAESHIASNGFVAAQVKGDRVQGAIELAIRDVELAVGLDEHRDGKVTWGELRAASPRLALYAREHFALSAQGRACEVSFGTLMVNERVDGSYAWLPYDAHCPLAVASLGIQYSFLLDVDPSHRGLLTLATPGGLQTRVLGGTRAVAAFNIDHISRWHSFIEYLQAGVWHIWSGIDHLLFLLSLLLPAVLVRSGTRWEPVTGARPALLSILKVVTAFTIAHSITLTLAALDIVRLPSRLTESVIAASIIVAALNNIFPLVTESRARIAFAFGLLHGFGFASVLSDMGLPSGARVLSLLAFNLGIECGQLAVVIAIMPVVYALRERSLYRRAIMPWGSAAIASLALFWLAQRAFLLQL